MKALRTHAIKRSVVHIEFHARALSLGDHWSLLPLSSYKVLDEGPVVRDKEVKAWMSMRGFRLEVLATDSFADPDPPVQVLVETNCAESN